MVRPTWGGEIEIPDDRDAGIGAVGAGDAGGDSDDDEGPPASRLSRIRRPAVQTRFDFTTGRYNASTATSVALTVITMLAAAIPQVGGFYIYLGSGAPREGDVTSHLRQLSSHPIVLVDLHVGGYDDDLRDPHVAQAIERAARDPRCQGVLVPIPCKTWSAARSRVDPDLPHSLPLRTQRERLGITRADGTLPASVDGANRPADHAAAIMRVADEHGGFFIAEAPPGRGTGSRFPVPGREDHTPQFDHPSFVQLREDTGASIVHFDQCRTRDDPESSPEKKTALMASRGAIAAVRTHFGPLVCN